MTVIEVARFFARPIEHRPGQPVWLSVQPAASPRIEHVVTNDYGVDWPTATATLKPKSNLYADWLST
jgi:hypothetical protein